MSLTIALPAASLRGAMNELDDKQLLELYHAGDVNRMFNEMVRRYQSRIYWTVRRMVRNHEDADDITQEVFVRAYTALSGFRGDSAIFTWLYRIAYNLTINHIRRQKVRRAFDLSDYIDFIGRDADQDTGMIHKENVDLIQEAIETLPPKQRMTFVMRYFDEMPYEQISAILGTSVGGLKANFHHAVKKVAAHVKKHHGKINLDGTDPDEITGGNDDDITGALS